MAGNQLVSRAILIAKLAATAVAFWLIVRAVDLTAAARAIRGMSVAGAALALVLLWCQVAINGVRWSLIAQSSGIALSRVAAIVRFWESLFFGQLTPSGVGGDAWRVYAVVRGGAGVANAMNTVIFDRLIGAGALVLMAFGGFVFQVSAGRAVDVPTMMAGSGLAAALFAGVVVLVAIQKLPERPRPWDRFGLTDACRRLSALISEALRKPALIASTLALSIAGHAVTAFAVWVLARAVGFEADFGMCLIVVPLAVLISMIPITINGWGLREGVVAAGLVHMGADLDPAAAISVLFGLGLVLIGLTGGAWLWLSQHGPGNRKQDEKPAANAQQP